MLKYMYVMDLEPGDRIKITGLNGNSEYFADKSFFDTELTIVKITDYSMFFIDYWGKQSELILDTFKGMLWNQTIDIEPIFLK